MQRCCVGLLCEWRMGSLTVSGTLLNEHAERSGKNAGRNVHLGPLDG